MITIPVKTTKKWSTSQNSDLFGNIVRSRALDFNKPGYLSIGKKPICLYTRADNSNFKTPLSILNDDTYVYVLTTGQLFVLSTLTTGDITVAAITGGAPPTFGLQSDACFFNGIYHASGTTTVDTADPATGNWTNQLSGLSASYPHPLCVSEHQQYLAVGIGPQVKLYDTSYTLKATLTIPSEHYVVWIRWKENVLYIGTRNIKGGQAKVFSWNGSGTAAQSAYAVQADWCYSGCEYDSSIAVITSAGQILRFNGSGFSEIANLPVNSTPYSWSSTASNISLVGKVASRGMIAKGRKLYINLDGTINVSGGVPNVLASQPGGLWVFDPDVGLYHKAGYGNQKYQYVNITSVAANVLTIAAAANYETGDPVVSSSGVGLTGLLANQVYYAIKVTTTTLKLALSPSDALAGRSISVSGVASGGDNLSFDTYRSVGATRIEIPGAVATVERISPNIFFGSEVFFGGQTNNNVTAVIDSIMSLGLGKNVASFVTPKMQADSVVDIFKKLFTRYPVLNLPQQQVAIKYRLLDKFGLPVTAALNRVSSAGFAIWQSSTTFNVDTRYYDFKSAAVGDEIEFTEGALAGYTAHISSISTVSDPTYLVTVDETFSQIAVNDKSDFMVNNWTKIKIINTTNYAKEAASGWSEDVLNPNVKWIQFKIELRGFAVDIEELALINGPYQNYE